MMSTPSTGFASYAYSVVDQSCAASYLSLAHEMGHNMGLNHDPANSSGTPSYTYAYGYQQPSGLFRTVMAYPCPSGSCPRLMYFSNPDVAYQRQCHGNVDAEQRARAEQHGQHRRQLPPVGVGKLQLHADADVELGGRGRRDVQLYRHVADRVCADSDEQPVVADDHQWRLGFRDRYGGLQRGRQHGRHEPQRDDHRRRQDVHRDAGGRGVQLLALVRVGVAGGSRRHRQLHRHDDDGVRVDGGEQPVVADDHQLAPRARRPGRWATAWPPTRTSTSRSATITARRQDLHRDAGRPPRAAYSLSPASASPSLQPVRTDSFAITAHDGLHVDGERAASRGWR